MISHLLLPSSSSNLRSYASISCLLPSPCSSGLCWRKGGRVCISWACTIWRSVEFARRLFLLRQLPSASTNNAIAPTETAVPIANLSPRGRPLARSVDAEDVVFTTVGATLALVEGSEKRTEVLGVSCAGESRKGVAVGRVLSLAQFRNPR